MEAILLYYLLFRLVNLWHYPLSKEKKIMLAHRSIIYKLLKVACGIMILSNNSRFMYSLPFINDLFNYLTLCIRFPSSSRDKLCSCCMRKMLVTVSVTILPQLVQIQGINRQVPSESLVLELTMILGLAKLFV